LIKIINKNKQNQHLNFLTEIKMGKLKF
jgi:hypothetical protein